MSSFFRFYFSPSIFVFLTFSLEAFKVFSDGKEKLDAQTVINALARYGLEVKNAHEVIPEPLDYSGFMGLRSAVKQEREKAGLTPKTVRHIHNMEPGDYLEEAKVSLLSFFPQAFSPYLLHRSSFFLPGLLH